MIWPFKRDADRSRDASVHDQRGLEHLSANGPGLALTELEQALRQDPDNHEIMKSLGNAHKAAGDLEKAADCYRRSLRLAPDYPPSLYNLGLALHELSQLDEAEELFRRAHAITPGDADVLVHLGVILCKRSRFADGADMFRAAVRLSPEDAKLWLWLARACHEIPQQIDESIQCLRKCIALQPGFADAYCHLGVAYRSAGDARQAAEAFGKALELQPASADAIDGLGGILQDEGKLDEAIEHYRTAIRSWPDSAKSYSGLGCALARKGRLAEAADCFRNAIGLQKDFADALHNLGIVLGLQGARDQALRCSEEALRLKPGDAAILECILFEKQHMCDWAGFEELSRMQRRRAFEHPERPSSPFSLLSIPSTRAEQLQCARNFAQIQLRAVARDRLKFDFDRPSRDKLRIGYLSSDFHEHATAYLMAELFELHDRRRFEVLAYSYGEDDGSPMRVRLTRAFDRFTDIGPLSHALAAAAIHADGTEILVDLKGYTEHARTGIVALRPAPVQVSYLGYPGTMGAEFIDYLVADRFVVLAEHAADYSEHLVLLPSYQVNDRKRPVAPTPSRRELGLPENGFVFCCFNQPYKILPDLFTVWMRLLQAVPGSVLWLLESNPWVSQHLHREARTRGIEPPRLVFAPRLPLDRHLGRMRAADLFLDTLPCNAHTTASDALWAGLPVLTMPGDTFASRVAGSLLSAVGMPELIVGSMREYEDLALSLAREPVRLAALRGKLARNKDQAPLFDTPGFVRNLESAYEKMWQHYLSGEGPRAIAL